MADFKVQDCSFHPLRGLLARRLINLGFQKVPGDIRADHRQQVVQADPAWGHTSHSLCVALDLAASPQDLSFFRGFHSSLDCPGTRPVDQADLTLRDLPASVSKHWD